MTEPTASESSPPVDKRGKEPSEACCEFGPPGHTEQQHHDASACFDVTCSFDHPFGGPFPHPCDRPLSRADKIAAAIVPEQLEEYL